MQVMTQKIQQTLVIPPDLNGLRLDQALAKLLPDYSRTQIQAWIKQESIRVNDDRPSVRMKVVRSARRHRGAPRSGRSGRRAASRASAVRRRSGEGFASSRVCPGVGAGVHRLFSSASSHKGGRTGAAGVGRMLGSRWL